MDERTLSEVTRRLDLLERENRTLRRAMRGGALIGAVVVAAAVAITLRSGVPAVLAQAPEPTPTVAVQQQVVAQQVSAQLVSAQTIRAQRISVVDRQGRDRGVLTVTASGAGQDARDVPSLVLTDESGSPIISIALGTDSASVSVFDPTADPAQRTRASTLLGVTTNNEPLILATDATGATIFRVPPAPPAE